MTEEQKKRIREQLFFTTDFQKKWNKYLKTFGKDLDELFCDDFDKKMSISELLYHNFTSKSRLFLIFRHFSSIIQKSQPPEWVAGG